MEKVKDRQYYIDKHYVYDLASISFDALPDGHVSSNQIDAIRHIIDINKNPDAIEDIVTDMINLIYRCVTADHAAIASFATIPFKKGQERGGIEFSGIHMPPMFELLNKVFYNKNIKLSTLFKAVDFYHDYSQVILQSSCTDYITLPLVNGMFDFGRVLARNHSKQEDGLAILNYWLKKYKQSKYVDYGGAYSYAKAWGTWAANFAKRNDLAKNNVQFLVSQNVKEINNALVKNTHIPLSDKQLDMIFLNLGGVYMKIAVSRYNVKPLKIAQAYLQTNSQGVQESLGNILDTDESVNSVQFAKLNVRNKQFRKGVYSRAAKNIIQRENRQATTVNKNSTISNNI